MKVKVEAQFTDAEVRKEMQDYVKRYHDVLIAEYSKVARAAVKDARVKKKSQGGFNDQTGNLRASIGYILMYDGKQVAQDFIGELVGQENGKRYAREVGDEYPVGFVIVIVAGMEYGRYVEAMGYDVITGSTLGMKAKFDAAHKRAEKTME